MLANDLKEWRLIVLNRDKRICQLCHKPGNVADHIKPKKQFPELKLEIENGRCLCQRCHYDHGSRHNIPRKKYIVGVRNVLTVGNSLAIVIPKEYVKSHGLIKGQKLAFVISDNDLNYHLV